LGGRSSSIEEVLLGRAQLLESLALSVAEFPDRTALATHEGEFSYSELYSVVGGIQGGLKSLEGSSKPLIGVMTGDDHRTYASILAILASGAGYVPISRTYPASRVRQILDQAGISCVLTSGSVSSLEQAAQSSSSQIEVLDVQALKGERAEAEFEARSKDDIAYVFFTSGSTGKPKGVPITFRNLDAFFRALLEGEEYRFSPDDRFLQMFSLTFDLSVMSLFTPLAIGGCCCVVPDSGIAWLQIVETLRAQNVTVSLMVPSVLGYLERYFDEIRLPDIRHSMFCGEALAQSMVAGWSKCVPNAFIRNVYGPTEATIFCSSYDWSEEDSAHQAYQGVVPIGSMYPGMEARLLGPDGAEVPTGEQGELVISGEQVMTGYFQDVERTAEAFIELAEGDSVRPFYRTGDLCFHNEQGDLVYCGRLDSQVKVQGHRVELGEIEHFARQHVGHSFVAAVLPQEGAAAESIALFVQGEETDLEGLETLLAERLPSYMVPREIRAIEEMPLNLNGKIDRLALRQRLE
jgi:amino acid adenylation domain-containing protein